MPWAQAEDERMPVGRKREPHFNWRAFLVIPFLLLVFKFQSWILEITGSYSIASAVGKNAHFTFKTNNGKFLLKGKILLAQVQGNHPRVSVRSICWNSSPLLFLHSDFRLTCESYELLSVKIFSCTYLVTSWDYSSRQEEQRAMFVCLIVHQSASVFFQD